MIEALLSLVLILAVRSRALGLKQASGECVRFLLPFIPGGPRLLVMGLVWPWGVAAPLNPFRALQYFSHDFVIPWRDLFDGRLISILHMPRSYVPTLLAVQLPELMLALGLCGFAGAVVAVGRAGRDGNAGQRAALLAVVLAVSLPIVMTVITLPYIFNGIRHLLFVVPPIAVLGGLAGAWIARRLAGYGRARDRGGAHRAHRRHDFAGRRHDPAAPLRVHGLQSSRRRRKRRAAAVHAGLLGAFADAGVAGAARDAGASVMKQPPTGHGKLRCADRIRRSAVALGPAIRASSGIRKGADFALIARGVLLRQARRARAAARSCATASSMRAFTISAAARSRS